MKKKIIILAAAIAPLAFFSCSKEKIETQPVSNDIPGQDAPLASFASINNINLKNGLAGYFQFDGSLQDKSGKLSDGIVVDTRSALYTTDRNGVANSAIRFTGNYGVDIAKVTTQPNTSIAAWVKYTVTTPGTTTPFVTSWNGPNFVQDGDKFAGVIITPTTTGVFSGALDSSWHHLAATYDGSYLKFYVDGRFVGTSLNGHQFNRYQLTYNIGYWADIANSYWQGCIDDLCFYSRTLSAAEVQKLLTQSPI